MNGICQCIKCLIFILDGEFNKIDGRDTTGDEESTTAESVKIGKRGGDIEERSADNLRILLKINVLLYND